MARCAGRASAWQSSNPSSRRTREASPSRAPWGRGPRSKSASRSWGRGRSAFEQGRKRRMTRDYVPLNDVSSVTSILSKISFLGGVPDEQRDEVFRHLEVGSFKKGEYISKRGEPPSHIYIIRKGKVAVMITDNEVAIRKREFNVGDCFGEAALLS